MKIISATDWKSRFSREQLTTPWRIAGVQSPGRSTLQGMQGNCKFPVGYVLSEMGVCSLELIPSVVSVSFSLAAASDAVHFRCFPRDVQTLFLLHHSIAITRPRRHLYARSSSVAGQSRFRERELIFHLP